MITNSTLFTVLIIIVSLGIGFLAGGLYWLLARNWATSKFLACSYMEGAKKITTVLLNEIKKSHPSMSKEKMNGILSEDFTHTDKTTGETTFFLSENFRSLKQACLNIGKLDSKTEKLFENVITSLAEIEEVLKLAHSQANLRRKNQDYLERVLQPSILAKARFEKRVSEICE